MSLAVGSYAGVALDDPTRLNLAWVTDEKPLLDLDLDRLVGAVMDHEATTLSLTSTYLVQDPYGEARLQDAVAGHFGLAAGRFGVTAGAGVGSLLHGIAALAAGGTCLVDQAGYADLPHWVRRFGGQCRPLAGGGPAELILLERPQLTGHTRSLGEVAGLCADHPGALVVVDESYGNYCAPGSSAAPLVLSQPNLVVLRGLSKAYWLGGVRLGFAIAGQPASARIRSVLPPMTTPALSLLIAARVLAAGDLTGRLRAAVRTSRRWMVDLLVSAGIAVADGAQEVPHVHCPDLVPGCDQLEIMGVTGKMQPFYDPVADRFIHRMRLCTPLSAERRLAFASAAGRLALARRGAPAPAPTPQTDRP